MDFLKFLLSTFFTLSISYQLQASNSGSQLEMQLTHSELWVGIEYDHGLKLPFDTWSAEAHDHSSHYYRLHLKSKQKLVNREFKLFCINYKGQVTGYNRIWFDSEGKCWMYSKNRIMPFEINKITIKDPYCGQFVDICIEDNAGNIEASTRICTVPISRKAPDGACASLQLQSLEGQYRLIGCGFKPNERVAATLQPEISEEKAASSFILQASSDGNFTSEINHKQVSGRPYGSALLILTRQDGARIDITYVWGVPFRSSLPLKEEISKNFKKWLRNPFQLET